MLVRFVKNSALVKLINQFNMNAISSTGVTHQAVCQTFIDEIRADNYGHPTTFSNEQCHFYLTYLYLSGLFLENKLNYSGAESDLAGFLANMRSLPKENILHINPDEFLQTYQLWMVSTDYHNKFRCITPSSDLEKKLHLYINKLSVTYPHVSKEAIAKKISELEGIHRLFSELEVRADTLLKLVVKPAETALINTPAISIQPISQHQNTIIIPPIALVKWLANQYNMNSQIEMEPIFGRINEATLYELHLQNRHPVSLRSPLVKHNLTSVHELETSECTSLSIAAHDALYHFMALSLFPRNIYLFVLNNLIPKIQQLKQAAATPLFLQPALAELLRYFNDFATDSDTYALQHATPEDQLLNYTCDEIFSGDTPPGISPADIFFSFLLLTPLLQADKEKIKTEYHIDVHAYISKVLSAKNDTPLTAKITQYVPRLIMLNEADTAYHLFDCLDILAKCHTLDAEMTDLLFQHKKNACYTYDTLIHILKYYRDLLANREMIINIIASNWAEPLHHLLMNLSNEKVTLPTCLIEAIIQDNALHLSIPDIATKYKHLISLPHIAAYLAHHPQQADKILSALDSTDNAEIYTEMFTSPTLSSAIHLCLEPNTPVLTHLFQYGKRNHWDYSHISTASQILFDISPSLVTGAILCRLLALTSSKVDELYTLCHKLAALKKSEPGLFQNVGFAKPINGLIKHICKGDSLPAKLTRKLQNPSILKLMNQYPDIATQIGYTSAVPSSSQKNRPISPTR